MPVSKKRKPKKKRNRPVGRTVGPQPAEYGLAVPGGDAAAFMPTFAVSVDPELGRLLRRRGWSDFLDDISWDWPPALPEPYRDDAEDDDSPGATFVTTEGDGYLVIGPNAAFTRPVAELSYATRVDLLADIEALESWRWPDPPPPAATHHA